MDDEQRDLLTVVGQRLCARCKVRGVSGRLELGLEGWTERRGCLSTESAVYISCKSVKGRKLTLFS